MNSQYVKETLLKFQSIIALLLMCIALSLLSDKFLTVDNTWNVMRQISVNVVISVGMTLVILTAGIDLSVGSILALCGVITASLIKFGIELPGINLFIEFTILGAILALAAGTENSAKGIILLATYAAGLGVPFVLVAVFFPSLRGFMAWMKRHMRRIELSMGLLLWTVGLMMVSGQFTRFSWWILEQFPALATLG